MKIKLASFIVAIGLMVNSNGIFAETPDLQPKLEQTISPEKLVLARQLVQVLGYQEDWEKEMQTSFDKAKAFSSESELKALNTQINTLKSVNLNEPMAKEYAQLYTTDELQQLLKFYNTPQGKQINQKNKLMKEIYQQVQLNIILNVELATASGKK